MFIVVPEYHEKNGGNVTSRVYSLTDAHMGNYLCYFCCKLALEPQRSKKIIVSLL